MFDPIRCARPAPDLSSIECQDLTEADCEELWDAANRLVNTGGVALGLTAWLSSNVQSVVGRIRIRSRVGRREGGVRA